MPVPTDYLMELRDLVKTEEPELWNFFTTAQRDPSLIEQVRGQLLRSNYRLDDTAHDVVLDAAARAAESLGVTDPVTVYQSQESLQRNAFCLSLPGEAHVVFSGELLELLEPAEVLAVMGHELAHHALWSADGGEFWILDRLIGASADDLEAGPSHEETARLVRLHTEIVADRGMLEAVDGDVTLAISALVKLSTGLRTVSGEAYLRQAREALVGDRTSDERSHPETFVRAWALDEFAATGDAAEPEIAKALTGTTANLDRLDLVAQHRLTLLTTDLIRVFLQPAWVRTDAVLAHARKFGKAAVPTPRAKAVTLDRADFASLEESLVEYFSLVLLDFATVDPDIADATLAASLMLSDTFGLKATFDSVVRRELGLTVKELKERRAGAPGVLGIAETA